MIARTWRGATRPRDSERYIEYMQGTGLKEYRETAGNLGILVLSRASKSRTTRNFCSSRCGSRSKPCGVSPAKTTGVPTCAPSEGGHGTAQSLR